MPEDFYKVSYESGQGYKSNKPGERFNKNLIFIILSLVLAVILVIFAVARFSGPAVNDERIVELAEKCSNGECSSSEIGQLSRSLGDFRICEGLSGFELYSCAVQFGIDDQSTRSCSLLEGEGRSDCNDVILSSLATDLNEVDFCRDIIDQEIKNNCIQRVLRPIAFNLACNTVSDNFRDVCNSYQQEYQEFLVSNCEDFAVEGDFEAPLGVKHANCQSFQALTDRDNDGLSLLEEFELGISDNSFDTDGDGLSDFDEVNTYGTDPVNPDTDGDGFNDGLEVEGGFDPLSAPEATE